MGNSCCPPSNPCNHTVDETKGLLSSSDSKNSTKAEGAGEVNFNSKEVEEGRKNEEELVREVVIDQPIAVAKHVQAQSSYSTVIHTLHTDISRATQASQSSSLVAPKEPVKATIEIVETKKEDEIEEVRTTDDALPESIKAPVEIVTAKGTVETKTQITDVVVKVDKSAVTALRVQEGPAETHLEVSEEIIKKETAEVEGQKAVDEVAVQKEAAEVDIQKEAATVDVQNEAADVVVEKEAATLDVQNEAADVVVEKEAATVDVQNEAADVVVEKEAATVDVQNEAADVVVEKEAVEDDLQRKAADVDTENQAPVVDIEKMSAEVDIEKKTAEVGVQKEAAEVDIQKEAAGVNVQKKASEEKPETPVDVLIEKDATQTQQQALHDSTAEKLALDHLITEDVAQNNNKVDVSMTENGDAEPQTSSPKSSGELDIVDKSVPAKVINEEAVEEPTNKVDYKYEGDIASDTAEGKEDSLPSETQEHSEAVTSPAAEISNEVTPHAVENGQGDYLKDENLPSVDAALVPEMPRETELAQKALEESSRIESEAQLSETSANVSSTVDEVEKSESQEAAADQDNLVECLLNGLDSRSPEEKPGSTEAHGDSVQVENVEPTGLDDHIREEEESEHQLSEKEKGETTVQEPVEKEDTESPKVQKAEIILSSSHGVKVALIPVSEKFSQEKEEEEQVEEDLYRGAEEIELELPKEKQSKPLLEFTIPGVEERCSLAAAVDILAYSEREWKGNTAKSTLIRKGYLEMSCSFSDLRRVRGDNYCALRATLFQVLSTTTQTPAWLQKEDFASLPEKLEAQEHLIGGWRFPAECRKVGEKETAVEKLKHYMELLQKRWQAAAESVSLEEKQRLCERVFQSGEEEYGLLEVLKFLMLARAVELHSQMQEGQEVPVFCWLLFARDTSENPKTLLNNHLSQVGFSGGLEQEENHNK
ncbi:uncharacterized protein [Salminus brasiliensis]|uniref:uncharacterized protein isoform X2 n=1 Tax=Salminus brasiliensis TaxID=930266 RepID=UPI003B831CAF